MEKLKPTPLAKQSCYVNRRVFGVRVPNGSGTAGASWAGCPMLCGIFWFKFWKVRTQVARYPCDHDWSWNAGTGTDIEFV
ncbi:hypothetical protein GCM10008915_70100 [Bifidobacterium pullorum subsp. gallinarum]